VREKGRKIDALNENPKESGNFCIKKKKKKKKGKGPGAKGERWILPQKGTKLVLSESPSGLKRWPKMQN